MSDQAREKGANSTSKQLLHSVKGLGKLAKALRQLSGISLVLGKNLRRASDYV